jgi:hypothetical protein
MTIKPAQIDLADLLASGTNETQPRVTSSDRGTGPKVKPKLAPLGLPTVPDRDEARVALRLATSVMAARARFSSMSRRRALVPMCRSCAFVATGVVAPAGSQQALFVEPQVLTRFDLKPREV